MAYKFIQVYEKFGALNYSTQITLSATVLYALAAPSTPDSVVQQAIEKAEAGKKVTVADVKDWKADYEAERIKLRLKRTVEDIIEIGRELTAVKDELPHGQFLPWIAAEFEMSDQTARRFMDVHATFGDKFNNLLNFKPSVIYALAAPSTPDSVIQQAIEKAEAGEKVTVADVKDWKADYEAERIKLRLKRTVWNGRRS